MPKFIATSRQATEMDKIRILLEKRIQEVKDNCKGWAEVVAKAKDEAKELQNLFEELRADVVEFKASKQYTNLLDANYAAGFEDFIMDAMENFLEVDFSSIKLNLAAATISILQANSEDVNVKDDATTQLAQDDPNINAPPA